MNKFFAGLLGPLLLCACASPVTQAPLPWAPQVIRGQLANGLEYRMVRDSSQAGRLDLRLTVRAGSVDEDDDQVGVAHMLEHLTFRSRAGQATDLRAQMTALGWVQGRNFNAVTSYDRTQYLLSPMAGSTQAPVALEKLAQLVFAADYNAADLERERPIVIEEWRGGLGVAQRMNDQRAATQRVGSRYPLHRTIGNEGAIRDASLGALQRFQQRWYVPNNMILSVVGDFEPQQLARQIEQAFGAPVAKPLPDRDHRELPLDGTLKVFRLQDPQTGSNQVSLLFRLHEPDSRGVTADATRERLIDRMTLSALLTQLRRQPLQPGVRSLTAQKTLIGARSSVLGVAAGVEGAHHDAALTQLLTELERLRQHGFTTEDLHREHEKLRQLADGMLAKDESRTFEQWVTSLNDSAVQNRTVVAPHQIAELTLQALGSIDLAAINSRLHRWLDSPDQVLQLTAPGNSVVRLPTVDDVQQMRAALAAASLVAPAADAPVEAPRAVFTPPAPSTPGAVLGKRTFAAEHVEHWRLSNGDRLVWLRRNAENGQWRLQAESAAGFNRTDVPGWRLQMAAQLGSDSGGAGLEAWRKQHQATLSLEHSATRLQLSGTSQPSIDALTTLLQSYRQSQVGAVIDDDLFSAARDDLLSRVNNRPDPIASARRDARYGADSWQAPDLQTLEASTLTQDWHQLTQAPVTYFLMADLEPAALEVALREQLANIPRGVAQPVRPALQLPGQRRQDIAVALEPRVVLEASSFSPMTWTPDAAARVAALRELANTQLKQRLRGEASGVYRLRFDSELNRDTQRIESQLSFTCDPQRADELWALAQQTLAQLNRSVDAQWVASARNELRRQEKKRLTDPTTQWRRLLLSERQWQDPRYLSSQTRLPDGLRVESLNPLASQLFPANNQVLLRVLPKADAL
ncbi:MULTISPECIES: M16 family metallopeptidase [Pseudomonas]|uniref:M16 family metallopeptidase n=1 Tax=Pseudomonas TaxID=286 RepID=UPI000CFB25D1|nr:MULTISPECIES: pitrilysin family protein [Pseudomonas]PQZ91500.1 peptidase M16 [Pseudomonas trivialis]PRB27007.1 peptidase M16 [Pseudomonas sp. MYb60]